MFGNRCFRKALAVLLIIQLCFAAGIGNFIVPVSAAELNLLSDNFNNGQPDGWTFSGGGGFSGVENNRIRIQRNLASSFATATRQITGTTLASGIVNVEYKFTLAGNTGKYVQPTIYGASAADGSSVSAVTFQLRENGGVYMRKIRGNTTYYKLDKTPATYNCATNTEYTIKTQINTSTQKVNIWINNDQVLSDGDTAADITRVTSLYWTIATDHNSQTYYMDDLKVGLVLSDQAAVDYDYSWLDLGDVSGVTNNLTLPATGPTGSTISWASSNEGVITASGVITRSEDAHMNATLTATITQGTTSRQKVFQVTVLRNIPTESRLEWIHEDGFESANIPMGWSSSGGIIEDGRLRIRRLSGDGSASASRTINGGSKAVRGIVHTEYKFAMAGGPSNKWVQFSVRGRNLSNIDVSPVTIQFRENSGLYMRYKRNDTTYYKLGNFQAKTNEEHLLKVVLNTFTNKVNIWVDDDQVLADGDTSQDAVQITSLYWTIASDQFPSCIYLDGVKIGMQENYRDTVNADYDLLTLANTNKIIGDFTLPSKGMFDSDVSWVSDKSNFVRIEDGKAVVTRPEAQEQDVNVLLTATVSRDVYFSKEKAFPLTVLRQLSIQEMVNEDRDLLEAGLLLGQNKDTNSVLTDLNLPAAGGNNTAISWRSSDESVLRPDGQYGRVNGNVISGPYMDVTLTATIQKEAYSASKDFTLRVLNPGYISISKDSKVKTSSEVPYHEGVMAVDENINTHWVALEGDKNPELQIDLGRVSTFNCVSLQEKGSNVSGFVLQYSNNGKNWITAAEGGAPGGGQEVTYSFSQVVAQYVRYMVTSKGAGETGLVDIKVFKRNSDKVCVEEDAASIDLGDIDAVTENLELPEAGANQTVITWESSDPSVIKTDGTVIRASANKGVTMKATVTKGIEKAEKSFSVTVLGTGTQSGGSGGGKYVGPQRSSGGESYSTMPVAPTVPEMSSTSYTDVPESYWAKNYIETLRQKGVLSGTPYGRMEPERIIKREEFIKLVCLALGIADPAAASGFEDVRETDWFYPYVSSAVSKGIIVGTGGATFGTGQNITRQDMAVMISRAAAASEHSISEKREKNAFADEGDMSPYAVESIYKLQRAGIIDGNGSGSFNPGAYATRAEAIKVICSLMGIGL